MWKLPSFIRSNWNYTSYYRFGSVLSSLYIKNDYTLTWLVIKCFRKHRLCVFGIFNFLLSKVYVKSELFCWLVNNLIYRLKKKILMFWFYNDHLYFYDFTAYLRTLILYWWTYHFWWCIRLFLCNVYLDDWKNKSRSNK